MAGNNLIEIEVTYQDRNASTITVSNDKVESAYLMRSMIVFEGNLKALEQGDVICITAPEWVLETQGLI